MPAAYQCPDYKCWLKCGLVTLLYLTSSTGMLIIFSTWADTENGVMLCGEFCGLCCCGLDITEKPKIRYIGRGLLVPLNFSELCQLLQTC